ncbi:early nodulin protein [Salix suchowensis]|nr:early nodulin protein [Salix suchowensis]
MASDLFTGACKVFLFLIVFSSIFQFYFVISTEFLVGGEDGWTIPKKDSQMYIEWASKNRFKVDDTVQFKYNKDSVLVVTEEEYQKCRSAHPLFFSNDGDSVFKLDRPGLFYFISGVAGHCERGQKMIIKVLELETPPPPANATTPPYQPNEENGAIQMPPAIIPPIILLFSLSFLGFLPA